MACEFWTQKLLEHSSGMVSVASVVRMSSGRGAEMLFQNKLHQCLNRVKEIWQVQDSVSNMNLNQIYIAKTVSEWNTIIPKIIWISGFRHIVKRKFNRMESKQKLTNKKWANLSIIVREKWEKCFSKSLTIPKNVFTLLQLLGFLPFWSVYIFEHKHAYSSKKCPCTWGIQQLKVQLSNIVFLKQENKYCSHKASRHFPDIRYLIPQNY